MPNILKGETPLRLSDGRELTLVLDMEAMIEAETLYGKPLSELGKDMQRGFLGAIRATFYGALRAKHPSITPRDASDLIVQEIEAVTDALSRAEAASSLTKVGGKKPTEDGDSPNPPGTTSGNSGVKQDSTPKPSGGKRRARSN